MFVVNKIKVALPQRDLSTQLRSAAGKTANRSREGGARMKLRLLAVLTSLAAAATIAGTAGAATTTDGGYLSGPSARQTSTYNATQCEVILSPGFAASSTTRPSAMWIQPILAQYVGGRWNYAYGAVYKILVDNRGYSTNGWQVAGGNPLAFRNVKYYVGFNYATEQGGGVWYWGGWVGSSMCP